MRAQYSWFLLSAFFLVGLPANMPAGGDDKTGSPRLLNGHGARVGWLAFAEDGKTLMSGSWDRTVRFWDVPTGETRLSFRLHENALSDIAVSASGKLLASAGSDGDNAAQRSVKLWESATGMLKHTLEEEANVLSMSPDGKLLASNTILQTVRLWDTDTGELKRELKGFKAPVTALAFSADGKLLAAGSGNQAINGSPAPPGEVVIWEVATGNLRHRHGRFFCVDRLTFSPSGTWLAVGLTGSPGNALKRELQLWNLRKELEVKHKLLTPIVDYEVSGAAFSPNSQLLALTTSSAKLINVQSAALIAQIGDSIRHRVSAVAFSPDAKYVAVGGADRTIRLWDASRFSK